MENFNTSTEYTPTEDERALLDSGQAAIQALQAESQALLRCILRTRNLQGDWTWDGVKFLRAAGATNAQ